MTLNETKEIVTHIYDELAKGNSRPLLEAFADDVRWSVIGTTPWSGTYVGKAAVLDDLLAPLRAQFGTRYKARAHRVIGEGEFVVAEVRGEVTTKAGKPYNNTYCFIFRFADGRLKEINEYCDTDLLRTALEDPAAGG
jgi:ketosteroid isomerase-like protein